MFKQLAFVFLLVLVATAKKHRQDEPEAATDDEELKCLIDNCEQEIGACMEDESCFETIDSCSGQLPEDTEPSEEQINELETCLKQDQPAYDVMNCAIMNCSSPSADLKLNKHQRKTLHKFMRKMH